MENQRKEILLTLLGFGLILVYIFYSAKVSELPPETSAVEKNTNLKRESSPNQPSEKTLEAPLVSKNLSEVIPVSVGSSISRDEMWALFKQHFPQLVFESYSGCPAGYNVAEADSDKMYCEKVVQLSDKWVHSFLQVYDAGVLAYYNESIIKEKQNDYRLIELDFDVGDIRSIIIHRKTEECFQVKFSGDYPNALNDIYESDHSMGELSSLIPEIQKMQIENKKKIETITKTLCSKFGDLRACKNYAKLIKYDCI